MPLHREAVRSHPRRRRWSAALTVALLVVGLSLFGPGPSYAAAAAPVSDGCTLVPEAPAGVSFTPACNQHDECYYYHSSSRSGCDAIFYREMVQACNAYWPTNYYRCLSWASVYYVGVRIFGQPYYDASDGGTRVRTPMAA